MKIINRHTVQLHFILVAQKEELGAFCLLTAVK